MKTFILGILTDIIRDRLKKWLNTITDDTLNFTRKDTIKYKIKRFFIGLMFGLLICGSVSLSFLYTQDLFFHFIKLKTLQDYNRLKGIFSLFGLEFTFTNMLGKFYALHAFIYLVTLITLVYYYFGRSDYNYLVKIKTIETKNNKLRLDKLIYQKQSQYLANLLSSIVLTVDKNFHIKFYNKAYTIYALYREKFNFPNPPIDYGIFQIFYFLREDFLIQLTESFNESDLYVVDKVSQIKEVQIGLKRIKFEFITQPIGNGSPLRVLVLIRDLSFLGDNNGNVEKIEVLKMQLGQPDASGRPRPIPIENSEFLINCDTVILAIGANANPVLTKSIPELKTNKWGYIEVDENGKTNLEGIYAGGDIVTGSATVISAMGAGRTTAKTMSEYLRSKFL